MGTRYVYDPINGQIDMELDDNGNVLVEYTREPDGTLISEHRNGVSKFHHYDGEGNTTSLTDINGDVTDTFAYNASGEVTARTGTTPTPFQYHGAQGYYWDDDIGSFMVGRRPLDPSQGRWITPDLLPSLDGANLYIYVLNNPANLVDPTGLFAQKLNPVGPSCPVASGTCKIGTLDGSRIFLTLADIPPTEKRTPIEQSDPVPVGKRKSGIGYAIGFALADPFTPKGCEPLCCRGYGIIQVVCTDDLTMAGGKPKAAGKPRCWVDNHFPEKSEKPLPDPYYGGTYFEWGGFAPMPRPIEISPPTNDRSKYPTDIYDHFSSAKYRVAIFDRPDASVALKPGGWKRDELEACLVCDTGVSLKILQCLTHSMDAQTNLIPGGMKDVTVIQGISSKCSGGSIVKAGMKNNYPGTKIE